MRQPIKLFLTLLSIGSTSSFAIDVDSAKQQVTNVITANQNIANQLALKIAKMPEMGYQEYKSSQVLSDHLAGHGFDIKSGIEGMPTAFIATYGSGKPVIGFVAEFDALPGFSQAAVPHREAVGSLDAGHACGHHLLGVGAAESAIAVKTWMKKNNIQGTLQVFGSPAEEGGGGKIYLTRSGALKNVDVMLNWHPASFNDSNPLNNLANFSGKFRFHGQSAHAAAAPEKGRSALDAAEAMNFMVNSMREHVDSGSRIHYVITNGGRAPNVVPDFAEVYYYARHNDPKIAKDIWQRIVKAAKGAAMGTETRVEVEITNATYSMLPNKALSKLVHDNLQAVGGVQYTDSERAFAKRLQTSLPGQPVALDSSNTIMPFDDSGKIYSVSSDVGDMSWNTPTNWLNTATWVPGTAPHSWQAVAAGTMSIGLKGMTVASKTMAMSAVDLLLTPSKLSQIQQEFKESRGKGFIYQALVKDRKPPLEYRK